QQMMHRQELEKIVIPAEVNQGRNGQIFGFIIGMFTIACGFVCILMDHEFAGGFLGTAGLTGLVSTFVLGRRRQDKDLAEKR
ncbi:MAG: DUF2335 domain-containing protein, partial [Bacteroidota bacterium]